MRKIIGIGETILDIIFKGNRPAYAFPGGSVFNTMITLGRVGVSGCFISEAGRDRIGETVLSFMRENHLTTDYMDLPGDGKTPLSLAFLDEHNDAHYVFYTDYPADRLNVAWPRIDEDDVLIFGSYYSVNPVLRNKIVEILEYARDRKAIIYYDPNFRKAHAHEAMRIMPSVIENLEFADIVRGSKEDFENLYHLSDSRLIYKDKIGFYCSNFIYTAGPEEVQVFTPHSRSCFPVAPVTTVSTVGAGDSFNAGILFGLLRYGITRDMLPGLSGGDWEKIIRIGLDFSAEVCQVYENYLPVSAAERYKQI